MLFAIRNINDVLAQIIYEMTFFGYSQEDIEKGRLELEEATKEADEGKAVPMETAFADLGIEPQPRDEEDIEMLGEIYSMENEYNQHWLGQEVEKVKGKRISELSESEKRKFLYSAETPAPEQKEAENND